MIIVVPGCFDSPRSHCGLHDGHKALIKFAFNQLPGGDDNNEVNILLNDDESVRRLKGNGRPLKSLDERTDDIVNYVMLEHYDKLQTLRITRFNGKVAEMICNWNADVMIKGAEYESMFMADKYKLDGACHCKECRFANMIPGVSTTILLESEHEKKDSRVHDGAG